MPCSKEKLPTGHLRLPKPWPEQALNRHRVRWKPLRKGWAKYRVRRSMLSGKPWRVRVQPMALVTRPRASRLWQRCGALLVSRLLLKSGKARAGAAGFEPLHIESFQPADLD